MTETLRIDRPLIDAIYAQAEPNEPIDLRTVTVSWEQGGNRHQTTATASMRFIPDDRLNFVMDFDGPTASIAFHAMNLDEWNGKLTLQDTGVTIDTHLITSRLSSSSGGTLTFAPKRSVVTPTNPSDDITKVTFHLFNFPNFIADTDYFIVRGNGWTRCGRVILKAEGWEIIIAANEKTKELCDRLRDQDGFVITHVGKIQRIDGGTFTTDDLQGLLTCLHFFLSLALGRWAGLALPVGFDVKGTKVFEQWGLPLVARGSWHGTNSWFDENHGQLLSQVFPKFYALWRNQTWQPTLQAAMYWYFAANNRGRGIGVDAGIILAQTALERLAWTYCVVHRKMISKAAFTRRGLSAADKLRLFSSALGVPTAIPPVMSALNLKPGCKWNDVPDAITSIRNSLVHPSETASIPDDAYFEAWQLSTWMLDLAFLRICGHDGNYSNRTTKKSVGEVEQVPWSKLGASSNDTADKLGISNDR